METLSRRTLLKLLSSAPVAAGFALTAAEAQQAHHQVQAARQAAQRTGSTFKPQFFTDHEYQTVRELADMIIPADDRSGSATDAGVPEFMDFILIDMPARQTPIRGGLAWLDLECQRRFDTTFLAAADAERRQVLDDISMSDVPKPGLSHGQAFFRTFRDLVSSGFWTSKMGIEDLAYMGNTFVAEWTGCPTEVLEKLALRADD